MGFFDKINNNIWNDLNSIMGHLSQRRVVISNLVAIKEAAKYIIFHGQTCTHIAGQNQIFNFM